MVLFGGSFFISVCSGQPALGILTVTALHFFWTPYEPRIDAMWAFAGGLLASCLIKNLKWKPFLDNPLLGYLVSSGVIWLDHVTEFDPEMPIQFMALALIELYLMGWKPSVILVFLTLIMKLSVFYFHHEAIPDSYIGVITSAVIVMIIVTYCFITRERASAPGTSKQTTSLATRNSNQ